MTPPPGMPFLSGGSNAEDNRRATNLKDKRAAGMRVRFIPLLDFVPRIQHSRRSLFILATERFVRLYFI
jgi:hypothetical protein